MNASLFLTSPMTHPLALHLLCIWKFTSEYLAWEPETIWEELHRLFGAAPSLLNKSKINACRVVHTSLSPFEDWMVFEKVVLPFGFVQPQFSVVQKPSAAVVANGVGLMQTLRAHPYSLDIEKFIAAVLLDAGFTNAPRQLSFMADRIRPVVPGVIYEKMEKILAEQPKELPEDHVLAAQLLRHRDLQEQLMTYKELQDEHVAIAHDLAAL